MHLSCFFFKPEAVSKHSVSLWIGYSVTLHAIKDDIKLKVVTDKIRQLYDLHWPNITQIFIDNK